ncbi:MAG TPA: hypothetical protein ENM97_00175 [Moorella mulderi]|nr:hypothetical protein [Moorella mulderi]
MEERGGWQEEMGLFKARLGEYGLSPEAIAKSSPETPKIRDQMLAAARVAAAHPLIKDYLRRRRRLPLRALEKACEASRSQLKPHEKYVTAMALLFSGPFPALRSFIEKGLSAEPGPSRGLVVEKKGEEALVLTWDGLWKRIKAPATPGVGSQLWLPPESPTPRYPYRLVASVVAVLLLGLIFFSLERWAAAPPPEPYPSYRVMLNFGPCIELVLDQGEKVLEGKGINPQGQKLLSSLMLRGEEACPSLEIILREALRQGYVLPGEKASLDIKVFPLVKEAREPAEQLAYSLGDTATQIFQRARICSAVKAEGEKFHEED